MMADTIPEKTTCDICGESEWELVEKREISVEPTDTKDTPHHIDIYKCACGRPMAWGY